MSQINDFEQVFLEISSEVEKLGMTRLDEDQDRILRETRAHLQEMRRLMESYIDFEQICDKLPDCLYIADKNGKTIYINDMYSKLSGITRGEVIGENVHQINKEKKLYENGIIPKILRTARWSEQIGIMKRTNTKVYITGIPIFDSKGRLKYAVAHDHSIEQLEAARDQLLRLKESQDKREEEIEYLRAQQFADVEIISRSRSMVQAVSTAAAVASTDATVLITGESGTGKEVIANKIVKTSKRSHQPFLKVNCGAIPESLIESELFGYEPGSFTGANRQGKTGIFELANHGTLLLDEIGEMPLSMQTKLLRVLQNQEITKVGASKPIPVDVRIIAATNRDLVQAIGDHTFREDLYYRLNVVPIRLAPLRERREDIDPLLRRFLAECNKKYNKQVDFYTDAIRLMEDYGWPGNIRELKNVVERLVVINRGEPIDSDAISVVLGIGSGRTAEKPQIRDLRQATAEYESRMIRDAIEACGSKRKAAQALGVDHSTLVKKCQRYGI